METKFNHIIYCKVYIHIKAYIFNILSVGEHCIIVLEI